MPRKTRLLHAGDEYLFVEAPGDPAGPSLQLFARTTNARAVPPGRSPTHQTEHGLWIQVARFDGQELELAPESPATLAAVAQLLLPRYADARAARIAEAKHPCYWIEAERRAVHGLHPAQPGGALIKLWSSEALAHAALRELGVEGAVHSTGDLREFLELRAEEGYAGALLDGGQIVFFCLDEGSRLQFLRVGGGASGAGDPDEDERDDEPLATHLLGERGTFELYEGDGALEPLADAEPWDRLLVRLYGAQPFLGHAPGWRCFALRQDGRPVTRPDPEGDGRQRMVALFHDPAAADDYRARHGLGRASIERIADPRAAVREAQAAGHVVRLHPEDHRLRGGPLWLDREGALLLLGYAGVWRSRDGASFERVDEEDDGAGRDGAGPEPDAAGQSSGST